MQWIVERVLSVVAARVKRDDFAIAADNDLIEKTPDRDVIVAAGD